MCFAMWFDIFLSVITSNLFMSLVDELKLWLLEISVPLCSYDLYHYYLWIVCPKPCPCFQWFSSCIMSQNPCPWYTLLQHPVRGIPYFNIYVSKHLDWDIFLWSLRSVFLVPLLLHRWPPLFLNLLDFSTSSSYYHPISSVFYSTGLHSPHLQMFSHLFFPSLPTAVIIKHNVSHFPLLLSGSSWSWLREKKMHTQRCWL